MFSNYIAKWSSGSAIRPVSHTDFAFPFNYFNWASWAATKEVHYRVCWWIKIDAFLSSWCMFWGIKLNYFFGRGAKCCISCWPTPFKWRYLFKWVVVIAKWCLLLSSANKSQCNGGQVGLNSYILLHRMAVCNKLRRHTFLAKIMLKYYRIYFHKWFLESVAVCVPMCVCESVCAHVCETV